MAYSARSSSIDLWPTFRKKKKKIWSIQVGEKKCNEKRALSFKKAYWVLHHQLSFIFRCQCPFLSYPSDYLSEAVKISTRIWILNVPQINQMKLLGSLLMGQQQSHSKASGFLRKQRDETHSSWPDEGAHTLVLFCSLIWCMWIKQCATCRAH